MREGERRGRAGRRCGDSRQREMHLRDSRKREQLTKMPPLRVGEAGVQDEESVVDIVRGK